MAAGTTHSLFLQSDGTLWAMGYNAYGQLGNGTSDPSAHPTPLGMASNVVAVAAGGSHSLFVTSDGTLWAAGMNTFGQLGDGTTTNANRPISVASNVVAVAGGLWHSLFVRADGTLWAMGDNARGQLGNGNNTRQTWPVQVAGFTVASISPSVMAFHSLAVALPPTPVTVTLGNLAQTYDGTAKPATVTTDPTNITTAVTYDGSASAPTNAGSYTVIAIVTQSGYVGGATNTLVIAKAASTMTLASSLNPSTFGSSVTFTSTVSPSAATGTVTFKDGATTLGTGTLIGGVATFAISSLSVGSHSLTAEYGGDGSYLASSSSVLTQVVNVAGTVWAGGTTNDWRISDATGTAGSFPGWDCPAVGGNLVITAASTNRFTLRVLSLTPPGTNSPGPMANFSQTTAYAWPIVAVSGAIIGFHPDKFTIDTNSLANSLGGGALSLSLSGSNLVLAFVPTANRPPVANPNTMTTVQNLPATITQARLLANDIDPDGDALSVTGVSPGNAGGGTAVSAGRNVTYTPLTNFVGTDSFTYSIADARGGVATATVTVTVNSGASQAQDIAYSPGGVTVKFAGVPGWSYNVQRATNSAGPWTVVHTTNAPTTGLFTYTDNYPPDPTGYYRLARNR